METKAIDGVSISQLQNKFMTSDRCCYYNGKWNIKDLILYSVCIIIGALLVHYLS